MLKRILDYLRLPMLSAVVFVIFFAVSLVSAADSLARILDFSSATRLGSSASQISFSTGGISSDGTRSGTTAYYNTNNDAVTVGNYLSGYYYDSNYGFFDLKWDNVTQSNNVQVVSSTDACGPGVHGFKLGGFAKSIETTAGSNLVGFIDFDYNNVVFVYYCDNDKKLHGYAYSSLIGFQSFEGIRFEVGAVPNIVNPYTPKPDPYFVNNTSVLVTETAPKFNSIQGDVVGKDWGKESIFYIVK